MFGETLKIDAFDEKIAMSAREHTFSPEQTSFNYPSDLKTRVQGNGDFSK